MDYKTRRTRVMEAMPQGSLALFFSGKAPVRSLDEAYPFSVNRNFYYLTGLDREAMTLALIKNGDHVQSVLFIEPFDPLQARWVGGRMKPEEAQQQADVDAVYPKDEMLDFIHRQMKLNRGNRRMSVGLDLAKESWEEPDDAAHQFAGHIRQHYPSVDLVNLHAALAQLRMIKDEDELNLMRQAQEATITAVKVMMRHCAPGINETELEGVFDFALMKQGVREHAFPTICASGANATILHYSRNNELIEDGDLVLCDLGGVIGHYCADITRTYPANGRFTQRQKQIYDIVLEGQRRVIAAIRPGRTLRQLNQVLVDFYGEQLAAIGLLEQGMTVRDYYFHSVSHHLGLDTHDVNIANLPLAAGMVITVEPGLYLEAEGIGIRIEDDILVSETGAVNLSEKLPHTTEEIETFMNKGE